MTKHTQAYLYAALSIILWSTVASAFKLTLRRMDVYQMVFFASVASALVLLAVLAMQGKLGLLRSYSRQEYLRSVGLGLLNPAIYYIILFKAYSLLPAQEAQPLNMTWPLVMVLLSVPLLGQRIGGISILAVFISFFGVLYISTHGDLLGFRFSSAQGSGLAVGSAFLWALFWIANLRDGRDEVAKLFLSFSAGVVFAAASVALFSDFVVRDAAGLLGAIYVGVFEMGITFVTWSRALALAKTTAHVNQLIYIIPFISLLLINLVVGEKILPSTMIGLLFVIGGILVRGLDKGAGLPDAGSPLTTDRPAG
jgi:drug/metabolite transporter (DMT)-like permease